MKLIIALTGAILFFSSRSFAEDEKDLKVCTASVVYSSLIEKRLSDFEKQNGFKLTFVNDVKTLTPPPALMNCILSGKAEVAVAAVPSEEWPKMMEKSKFQSPELAKVTYRVVGALVIKFFAHPDVKIKELSDSDVKAILTGEKKNWKELGGSDEPIVLVRQENSQARDTYLKKKIMADKEFAPSSVLKKTVAEVLKTVASTSGAVGYLQEDDVAGHTEIVLPKTQVYGRPISSATIGRPSEKVRKFERFLHQ